MHYTPRGARLITTKVLRRKDLIGSTLRTPHGTLSLSPSDLRIIAEALDDYHAVVACDEDRAYELAKTLATWVYKLGEGIPCE